MLLMSRKKGQEVVIGPDIRLTVLAIHGKQVRLGITAPGNISIYRSELLEALDRPDITRLESTVPPIANGCHSLPSRDSN
jgi:carbon storage regulator